MDTPETAGEIAMQPPIGYLDLLRTNSSFRNLWFGQVVSELGDWFAAVALLSLMLQVTGKSQVVGWFFIIIHIPSVLLGPVSGVLVDRLNRKMLMIAMDLARALLVLGYLTVHRADQIWLIYLITALEVALSTLFEPARTAAIPNICSRRELVAASTLGSITWSAMLAIGAGIGGLVAAAFGRNVCYATDSVSFLVSAMLISKVRLPFCGQRKSEDRLEGWGHVPGVRDILEGFRYLKNQKRVVGLLLVKTGWCLSGGMLLILSVFGQKIFPVNGSGVAGIGAL
jgi:MFS family permease